MWMTGLKRGLDTWRVMISYECTNSGAAGASVSISPMPIKRKDKEIFVRAALKVYNNWLKHGFFRF